MNEIFNIGDRVEIGDSYVTRWRPKKTGIVMNLAKDGVVVVRWDQTGAIGRFAGEHLNHAAPPVAPPEKE